MRSLLLTLSLLVCGYSLAYAGPSIKPSEASEHVGETVEITGKVAQVVEKNGNVFVNFDAPYPQQSFYAFVPRSSASLFKNELLQGLEGKSATITGVVKLHKGKPEIVVTRANQIQERVKGYLVPGVNWTR